MTGLLASLAAVGAILVLAGGAGLAAAGALVPPGPAYRLERLAWSFAVGLALLSGFVPASLALGLRPGWITFLASGALWIGASRLRNLAPVPLAPASRGKGPATARFVLLLLLALGVLLYLLRSLTEPMWSADFLAIWGWKGKTLFGAEQMPAWTWRRPEFSFTHPEYPLGLPFLYAGISFLLGRWDDHALALLFPALQVATAALLAGWLSRRGAPPPVALAAAAALALFEPLYRAFTTGMAEVPLSFFLLLLGVALDDALDGEPGALRRLALASLGAAALKNEGLFAAATAAVLALAAAGSPSPVRRRAAAAALLPAVAAYAAHRIGRGPFPLRDFRLGFLLEPDLSSRLALGLRTILAEVILPAAPGLLALGLLLLAGRRSPEGDRLLALAAVSLAAYAILPALCVWGPEWLARTAFARTAAALAPLAAAGTALRLTPVLSRSDESSGSATGPAE